MKNHEYFTLALFQTNKQPCVKIRQGSALTVASGTNEIMKYDTGRSLNLKAYLTPKNLFRLYYTTIFRQQIKNAVSMLQSEAGMLMLATTVPGQSPLSRNFDQ